MEEVEEVEVDEDRLLPPLLLLVQLLPLRFLPLLLLPLLLLVQLLPLRFFPLPLSFPPEVQVAEVKVEVEEAEVKDAEVVLLRCAPRDAYLPYLGDGCCSNVRQ